MCYDADVNKKKRLTGPKNESKKEIIKMKKFTSVVLVLVLVLALGATAFADSGIYITKNPTDEVRSAGGTAWFVSGAANYSSLSWTFMSPDGAKYSVQEFRGRFPYATVEGEFTTNLTIRNLDTEMNGWGVFCTFSNAYGPTDTAMAFLYVSAYVAPTYTYTAPTYTTTTYTAPTYTVPTYDYYTSGNTTYYRDGTSLTDFGDGSMMYTGLDGSMNFVNENGSFFNVYPNGMWSFYDSLTDSYTGGIFYD